MTHKSSRIPISSIPTRSRSACTEEYILSDRSGMQAQRAYCEHHPEPLIALGDEAFAFIKLVGVIDGISDRLWS